MKKILILLLFLFNYSLCFADGITNPPLNFETTDGSISAYPYQVLLSPSSSVTSSNSILSLSLGGGSGTPGGLDTQVQFNDGSSFGGDAGFIYNKTADTATPAILHITTRLDFGNQENIAKDASSNLTFTDTLAGSKTLQQLSSGSGLTAGSILFGGSNGLITENNSNFYWNNTQNRLGIGTNTPSVVLETVAPFIANMRFRSTSSGNYSMVQLMNNINSVMRAFAFFYTGSSFNISSLMGGAPIGEGAGAYTTGPYPFVLGTDSTARIIINSDGLINTLTNKIITNSLDSTGSIVILTAGNGLQIKEGTNATMGTETLSSGTVIVNTTAVTASSRIFLTLQNCSTCGTPYISARTAGTSFTISSTNASDASNVAWIIIEPAS